MQKMPRFNDEVIAQRGEVKISKSTLPSPYSPRGFSNILRFSFPGWSSAKDYLERMTLSQNIHSLLMERYREEKDGWQWEPHLNDINQLLEDFPSN
jgi:hypothetical protein